MNLFRRWWTQSTLLRLSVVLGAVTVLALAVIVVAAVFTEQSTGKASAINVAGSLRMQSYALATRIAALDAAPGDGAAVRAAIDGFERRLHSPRLLAALPPDAVDSLRAAHAAIDARWVGELRPLALGALVDERQRVAFLGAVDDFVAEVNRFVDALEGDAERRLLWLRIWLGVAFFAIFALVVTAIVLLQVEVFQPLSELLRSARAVRTGSFRARVSATGPDEMGQLGQAFNTMVEQLARLYGSLERQVAEKTADLERKNQSLALLYETTRGLSEKPLDTATLASVLDSLKRVLGVDGGVICVHRGDTRRGFPLVRDEPVPDLCALDRCTVCHGNDKLAWRLESTERGERRIVSVPLIDSGTTYGVMPLALEPGKGLEPWQIELAETIGRHIGAALAAAERREEHQRLALLEERSAIARELHDSLAQSLSYTKIQLMRLSALVEGHAQLHEAQQVLTELREGVASAYRQLRELLTTFRLKAGGDGLAAALRETVAEFERHSGVQVEVEDELIGIELSANEQIHVLQIVREALTNVEKHARARHVTLKLQREENRAICVTIDDDGVGIDPRASPRHHFGLAIMRDRAALLGGRIDIGARPGGGTRVQLRFVAATAFAASAAKQPARSSVEAN